MSWYFQKNKMEGGNNNYPLPPKTKRKKKNNWQQNVPFPQVALSRIWFIWHSSAYKKDHVTASLGKLLPTPVFAGWERRMYAALHPEIYPGWLRNWKESCSFCGIFCYLGLCCKVHEITWGSKLHWYTTMQGSNSGLKLFGICALNYPLQYNL